MAQSAAVRSVPHVDFKRAMRPIDLVHLAKQCLGDARLEREILRMFDTTVESYMTRLRAATSDAEAVMALHSIRGASAGVGAFTIADLAKAGESELRAGRPLNTETVDDLAVAVEEVRAFITRVLSSELA